MEVQGYQPIKLRIVNTGDEKYSVRVEDVVSGRQLHGVTRVEIIADAKEAFPVARITVICPAFDLVAFTGD